MQTNKYLPIMIEGAIMIALAQVLSFIPTDFSVFFSISLDMIPILLFTFRRGAKEGALVGLLYGIFKIVIGDLWALSAIQVIIEYTLPYASVGLAGLESKNLQKATRQKNFNRGFSYLFLGTLLGIFVRYFWHFVAGVWFWGAYAPEGMNSYVYSILVNGGHMVGTIVGVLVILGFLYHKSKKIFLP